MSVACASPASIRPTSPPTMQRMDDRAPGELLANAADGDESAWQELVLRYGRLVWSTIVPFRFDPATAADVSQTVWLRLVEHAARIRNPDGLASWLATTTRNEAIRVSRASAREHPSAFEYDIGEDGSAFIEEMLVAVEETAELVRAFRRLDDDCRHLLRLLTVEPSLSYAEVSEVLGRPVGSIGPTRGRCLDKLRQLIDQDAPRRPGP